jgi:DNA-binding CsgD family transcriptional regulator
MRDEAVLEVIDGLYEASVEPALWPGAMSRLTAALGHCAASSIPFRNPAEIIVSSGFDDVTRVYARDWAKHDTLISLGTRLGAYRGLVCDWERLDADEVARDPFYQEFRRQFGLGGYMGFLVEPFPGELMSFGAHLAVDRPPPGPAEQRQFQILGRHAVRALAVAMRTSALTVVQDGLAEALTRFHCGAAVIDGRGRVVLANSALEALGRDGLKIVAGQLRAARPGDQAAVDALARSALAGTALARGPDLALVSRPSGRRPLLLRAIPLPQARREVHFGAFAGDRFALVLVVDLDREGGGGPEAALRLFGLTPAEARVAALVGAGRSPREAAEALGIAEGTARILLKHAYGKLDISRQSELARLVTRLAALAAREASP